MSLQRRRPQFLAALPVSKGMIDCPRISRLKRRQTAEFQHMARLGATERKRTAKTATSIVGFGGPWRKFFTKVPRLAGWNVSVRQRVPTALAWKTNRGLYGHRSQDKRYCASFARGLGFVWLRHPAHSKADPTCRSRRSGRSASRKREGIRPPNLAALVPCLGREAGLVRPSIQTSHCAASGRGHTGGTVGGRGRCRRDGAGQHCLPRALGQRSAALRKVVAGELERLGQRGEGPGLPRGCRISQRSALAGRPDCDRQQPQ